ncbi:MAG: putative lipid II flippase FtsW [Clostridia bacterium]|nr:putative lipid II flippase FtsW [Clostridia bacterium]MBP5458774.1 putative lipid II flippase FtsW [Clostridia bacterium]
MAGNGKKAANGGVWIKGGLDVPFLIIVIALITLGLIMMFSASSSYSYYYFNDSLYYFKRQSVFAVLGLIVMFVMSRVNYHVLKRAAIPLGLVTFALLIAVLLVAPPPGFEEFHRWISLGPVTFQPSEVAKFAIILYFAWHMDRHFNEINTKGRQGRPDRLRNLGWYFLILAVTCVLVYQENHVSGTLLIFAIGVMMMFLAGFDYKWFAVAAVAAAILVFVVVQNPGILPEHAQPRILAWVDKSYDPLGVRWQTNQAVYAIGSGGFFGVGLGNSKMKQLYVSEPQNDFIFSIICEELGFIGALFIVILFALLVWRGFVIGLHAKDRFGSWLAMGIVFQVGLQAALNIGVVTDVLPNTGISLPFFSYGGTSLLMLIFEMGVVLSISRTAKLKKV